MNDRSFSLYVTKGNSIDNNNSLLYETKSKEVISDIYIYIYC